MSDIRPKFRRNNEHATSRASKKRPAARSRTSSKKAPHTGVQAGLRHISLRRRAQKPRRWKVCLTRRGKFMYKPFADSKYGGKTKALNAAKSWHAQMVNRPPVPITYCGAEEALPPGAVAAASSASAVTRCAMGGGGICSGGVLAGCGRQTAQPQILRFSPWERSAKARASPRAGKRWKSKAGADPSRRDFQ